MYKFSAKSKEVLSTCHPDIQKVLWTAIQHFDFSVIHGFRGEKEQNELRKTGASKKAWPFSRHNKMVEGKPLSDAVDIAPYPIVWKNKLSFIYLAGAIVMLSRVMKAEGEIECELEAGADWNNNDIPDDEKFSDLGHLQRKLK
jgi:peptidoglycan L-alanyl-D-glutamate endopeptidase CwlK